MELEYGTILMGILNWLAQVIQANANTGDGAVFFLIGGLQIASFFWTMWISMGFYKYLLKVVRGQPAAMSDLFSGGPYLRVLGAAICFAVLFYVGLCLLIVPGIIVALGLWPYLFLILDKDELAIDSLKKSWEITKGHKMPMFLFALLAIGVYILGLLACFVGVFVSVSIVAVGVTWIYLKITGQEVMPLPQ